MKHKNNIEKNEKLKPGLVASYDYAIQPGNEVGRFW